MDFSRLAGTSQTIESCQGEIFLLYIIQNKTAGEVIAILRRDYNFDVSSKSLKTKLGQWGYTKNVRRRDVVQILAEKARRQSAGSGKYSTFALRQRPVDLEQIERHRLRAGLLDVQKQDLPKEALNSTTNIAYKTSPPIRSITLPEHLMVSEKLLYDIDTLIKSSFEVGLWSFQGNDRMIKSSNSQSSELKVLHNFLEQFAIGCHAVDARNFARAGICWQRAFLEVEGLVKGKYYDIIPNLIQKMNDLNIQGHRELSGLLQKHIARCGRYLLESNTLASPIFDGLGKLDMEFMFEIEERIMKQFMHLFELYLGQLCYNSFVMMMDGARRRLLQCPWVGFDCLPDISHLDFVFGPANHRSMDVISMRVEILSHRLMYTEAEIEASSLIYRAEMIVGDEWKRLYNLTRGWYFLGCAQYFGRKRAEATQSLSNALRSDDELCKIDEFHIFKAERMVILKYLDHLRSSDWLSEEREGSSRGFKSTVGPLEFFRCCKEPTRPSNDQFKSG